MQYKKDILKLRSEGRSYREIQKILGCSKGTISYHLGNGQKQKTLERSKNIRSENTKKIREMKEQSGCLDCGNKYPHFMLQFDHLPEYEKTGLVSSIARRHSWKKALEEIDKCEIVCANCHSIRTWNRLQN